MMFPDVSEGAWMAFIAGMLVSPHCVGMCGPLYCSILPKIQPNGGAARESIQALYHLGRIISYTAIGALAGAISLAILKVFNLQWIQQLPWLLVFFLILFAVGLDKWIQHRIPFKLKLPRKFSEVRRRVSGEGTGLILGVMSPFLPCAPLYMVFWVALISGSPLFGAQIMLGFAVGTIPLLWLAQSQFLRNREKWTSKTVLRVQRGLALVAALAIAYRMIWIGGPMDGSSCVVM